MEYIGTAVKAKAARTSYFECLQTIIYMYVRNHIKCNLGHTVQ